MLLSLALIFLCGMSLGVLCQKLKLPALLGMLLTGIFLGPYGLDLLEPKLLALSADLRQIALIIILTRAGLNLDLKDLKKVGRPALLMCFVPASFEIAGMLLLAPPLLGVSLLEAAIMGAVIAAVSPAVIVPKMLKLMEGGYGTDKSIPQMIMAGASVDDVFVIVLFTAFSTLAQGGQATPLHFLSIPSAIMLGLGGGVLVGLLLSLFFRKAQIRDSAKVLIVLSFSFLLVSLERRMTGLIGFSGLLAVMALGASLQQKQYALAKRLSGKYSKLWVCAEILLFVLVGATVNIQYALKSGVAALFLIVSLLFFRMFGVFACLLKSGLNAKERLFSALAYLPKATVQAAIGGLPLAMGLACGEQVLTVAVWSILLTAPLGAALIDLSHKKLLSRSR